MILGSLFALPSLPAWETVGDARDSDGKTSNSRRGLEGLCESHAAWSQGRHPAEASAWRVFCPWLTSPGPGLSGLPGLPRKGPASFPRLHLATQPSTAPRCRPKATQAAKSRGPSSLSPVVGNHFCHADLTRGPGCDVHAAQSLPTPFLAGGCVASNACHWNLCISRRTLSPAPCCGVDTSPCLSFPHLQMLGDPGDLPRPVGFDTQGGSEWMQWVQGWAAVCPCCQRPRGAFLPQLEHQGYICDLCFQVLKVIPGSLFNLKLVSSFISSPVLQASVGWVWLPGGERWGHELTPAHASSSPAVGVRCAWELGRELCRHRLFSLLLTHFCSELYCYPQSPLCGDHWNTTSLRGAWRSLGAGSPIGAGHRPALA